VLEVDYVVKGGVDGARGFKGRSNSYVRKKVYSPMIHENPLMWNVLKKFAGQTEHSIKKFIPENVLNRLYKAKDFIG